MIKTKLFVVICLLATSVVAMAQYEASAPGEAEAVDSDASDVIDWGDFEISANVTGTSDYVWRGISQSANKPAIQGGFDFDYTIGDAGFFKENAFYIGAWASNIDFGAANPNTSLEIDVYTGVNGQFGDTGLGWDIGWLRYIYPGDGSLDFNEIYFGLSYDPIDAISLSAYYYLGIKIENGSPGNYWDISSDIGILSWADGADHSAVVRVLKEMSLGLHLGRYERLNGPTSYWDWKVALTQPFLGVDWEIAYTETDLGSRNTNVAEGPIYIFSVSKSF